MMGLIFYYNWVKFMEDIMAKKTTSAGLPNYSEIKESVKEIKVGYDVKYVKAESDHMDDVLRYAPGPGGVLESSRCVLCNEPLIAPGTWHYCNNLKHVPESFKATVPDVLAQRDKKYGGFKNNSRDAQELKDTLHRHVKWISLTPDKKESLEMIMHKVARILNGDPEYKDNWFDIAGYATLVSDSLKD